MDTSEKKQPKRSFPAAIAQVLSSTRIVINRGYNDGVSVGNRFLVYELSKEEIKDPITGESLGKLESVKGTGIAIHVQEFLTTIEAEKKTIQERTITKRKTASSGDIWGLISKGADEEEVIIPKIVYSEFEYPNIGNLVKKI